jgi:predicted ester cyclase
MAFSTPKSVVLRLIDEVQTGGDYVVFDELIDPNFVDHTPSPGFSPNRDGARELYKAFNSAFSETVFKVDFQTVEDGLVTTRKVFNGTHSGNFLGIEPTGRSVSFDIIDVLRVQDGRITDHWGVLNIFALMQQITAPAM